MVWSNDHVIEWVQSLGLESYAHNLTERGIHGGLIALDNDFDHEKFAIALQIPLADVEVIYCIMVFIRIMVICCLGSR